MQSTINERVKILIDTYCQGIPARFAKALGVAASVIGNYLPGSSREGSPSFDVLQLIAKTYPQISIDWLVNGEGEMLRKPEAGTNITGSQVATNTISGSRNTTTTGTGPQAAPDINIELLKCQMENENLKQQVKSLTELLELYKRHSTL